MSNGPIAAARRATVAPRIPVWKIGAVVIPENRPQNLGGELAQDSERWTVVASDGIHVTLESTRPSILRQIRRHARNLHPVDR